MTSIKKVEKHDLEHPTLIKICGITNREDAHAAIDAGADALGFIAVQESPRYVGSLAFQRIRDVLPDGFPLVVVAKRSSEAAKYRAPIVQYYEATELFEGLDDEVKRIQVLRVSGADSVKDVAGSYRDVHALLLDGFHNTALGGTGTRFEWSLASAVPSEFDKPVLLAGGLRSGNVAEALTTVRPYGVDVSSGVEDHTPGKKSHDLVRKFIAEVRAWDAENGRTAERRRFLDPTPSG